MNKKKNAHAAYLKNHARQGRSLKRLHLILVDKCESPLIEPLCVDHQFSHN